MMEKHVVSLVLTRGVCRCHPYFKVVIINAACSRCAEGKTLTLQFKYEQLWHLPFPIGFLWLLGDFFIFFKSFVSRWLHMSKSFAIVTILRLRTRIPTTTFMFYFANLKLHMRLYFVQNTPSLANLTNISSTRFRIHFIRI